MGKKRRLLSAKGKFGNKFSAHPRYKVANTVPVPKVNDDLNIIAKKIETIETEVLKTQDEIEKVVIEASAVVIEKLKERTRNLEAKEPS